VSLGDQVLAGVARGLVAVVVDANGAVREVHAPQPPEYRTAMAAPYRLYRLAGLQPSLPIGGSRWVDMTAAARDGAVDLVVNNFRPFDATLTLYATAATPMRPALDDRFSGAARPSIHAHVFDRADPIAREALERWLAIDALPARRLGAARFVSRVRQMVNDGGQSAGWGLAFGAPPDVVLVRATTDLPNPMRVLAAAPPTRRLPGAGDLAIVNAGGQDDWMFGAGWHRPERDASGGFRWSSADTAYVVLPIDQRRDLDLTVTLMPRDGGASDEYASVALNGRELGTCQLRAGWQPCTVHVPAPGLLAGANVLTVAGPAPARSSDSRHAEDERRLGVAVRQILVSRVHPARRAN
jgi:hypothetical protein